MDRCPVPPVDVEVTSKVRLKPRHFADIDVNDDPILIRIHPDLETGPITRLRGVLAHEAGHLLDLVVLEEGPFRRICRELGYRYTKDEELRADILAEWATGWRIYYGPDLVQRAGTGARGISPRPSGLR